MRLQIKLLIVFLGTCLPLLAFADNLPTNFPAELIYKEKPIDPLCFFEADESYPLIPLNHCGINLDPDRKVIESNKDLVAKGFVGFDYLWAPANKESTTPNCYSYYKVIGKLKDTVIIYTLNKTGGSGDFSGIYAIKRKNDRIFVKLLASGDRCNNGINDVSIKNEKVFYNENVTPSDFLEISKRNPHRLNPYDDLASCATCCVASANYELDLVGDKERFVSIDLGTKPIQSNTDDQDEYQSCFNKLVATYQKHNKRYLNPLQLNDFMDKFNQECIKNNSTKIIGMKTSR